MLSKKMLSAAKGVRSVTAPNPIHEGQVLEKLGPNKTDAGAPAGEANCMKGMYVCMLV